MNFALEQIELCYAALRALRAVWGGYPNMLCDGADKLRFMIADYDRQLRNLIWC
jgi:hypothetical protein